MANISSANGHVTVKGPAKSISAFMELADILAKWRYPTVIANRKEIKDRCNALTDNKEVSESTSFEAGGRWGFRENIIEMMSTLNTLMTDSRVNERDAYKWTTVHDEAYQQLIRVPITILFDYYDVESTRFFVEESHKIEWEPGELPNNTVTQIYSDDLEITAENYDEYVDDDRYDQSRYTVKKVWANENVDWEKMIASANFEDFGIDTPDIDGLPFTDKTSPIMIKLMADIGRRLDNVEDKYNELWGDWADWFEDEYVLTAISEAIEALQGTN